MIITLLCSSPVKIRRQRKRECRIRGGVGKGEKEEEVKKEAVRNIKVKKGKFKKIREKIRYEEDWSTEMSEDEGEVIFMYSVYGAEPYIVRGEQLTRP